MNSRDRIAPLVGAVVDRARDQGVLRSDFDSTDATFIQVALAAVMEVTRSVSPALYRPYLTIFLDGTRVDHGALTELPVPAPTVDHTHVVMAPDQPRDPSAPDDDAR